MAFFGKIGVDWRLVVAQAVNFGILAWIFGRFVYRPLLKGMSSSELEKAERRMEEVEKGRAEAEREKRQLLKEAKGKSAEMVEEAEQIAAQIKERVKQEAAEERKRLMGHLEKQAEAQKAALKESMGKQARQQVATRLQERFQTVLKGDVAAAEALQSAYGHEMESLIKETEAGAFDRNDRHLRVFWGVGSGQKDKSGLAEALASAVAEQLDGSAGDPELKRDPKLLAGYRIEAAGLVLERSLISDINHAVQQAES